MNRYENLKTEIRGQVAYCSLNRPDKRNALSLELLGELLVFLRDLSTGKDVRAVVLTGEGRVFSAGADLSMMSGTRGKTEADLVEEAGIFYDCFQALSDLPMPLICFVHGGVHGGACGLMASADFALADPGTKFSLREVRLGLIPATVAPFILRRTGYSTSKQLMLAGEIISAEEARTAGLVDRICSKEDSEREIAELTSRILKNAPEALAQTKKLLGDIPDLISKHELRDFCTRLIARKRLSSEASEGIKAFFEKRNPAWEPGELNNEGDR